MQAAGLRFDALVTPRHLPHPARVRCAARPDLRVVIDHGAKPDIAGGALRPLGGADARDRRATPARSASCPAWSPRPGPAGRAETLKPYVDVLLEAFGPARLMWGSDWPVVNEAGGYARLARGRRGADRGPARRPSATLIFGGTAAAFYGIAA